MWTESTGRSALRGQRSKRTRASADHPSMKERKPTARSHPDGVPQGSSGRMRTYETKHDAEFMAWPSDASVSRVFCFCDVYILLAFSFLHRCTLTDRRRRHVSRLGETHNVCIPTFSSVFCSFVSQSREPVVHCHSHRVSLRKMSQEMWHRTQIRHRSYTVCPACVRDSAALLPSARALIFNQLRSGCFRDTRGRSTYYSGWFQLRLNHKVECH